MINKKRIKYLREGNIGVGPLVYWMQREQRVHDNWALIYSYQKAKENKSELIVVFNLVTKFLEATLTQYHFLIEGLKEVEENLNKLNIKFYLTTGKPEDEIPKLIKKERASLLVTDFNPIRIIEKWQIQVKNKISIPFHQIDAHNIVPVWETSNKLEFAAYTIRPKINKQLSEFLDDFPKISKLQNKNFSASKIKWEKLYKSLKINSSTKPNKIFTSGEDAAFRTIKHFIEQKFDKYSEERNNPNKNAISNISPYLHFGQISAQRIALMLNNFNGSNNSVKTYLEELIVRRELSDNFCYYNKNYDNFNGFPDWAKKTLNEHRNDKREYIYSLKKFEEAKTHDDLWNAAQLEMIITGKMHGYMRMYWAKKILEWTESPEQAMEFAIYLNDKYELDGRDPNGYVGVAWSIGGVHDRAWTERPIFGKIRYMNYNGCKRKFNVKSYIEKFIDSEQKSFF
ncbi:MAG: deoxyribodipyrimidine photolyase [Ignavibacteriae bacterium]|nr:MAG: deoxyribodipyrimidine photolyase [Ignavibacteriota bacterium]